MVEVWKDIPDYEGYYQVSNIGRVRSVPRVTYIGTGNARNDGGFLKKQRLNEFGYLRVNLCKEGKRRNYFVHRLVAVCFIPNPNNLPFINHKDEDKTNNRVDNLEWCTQEYNSNYGTRNERLYANGGGSRKKEVEQYDLKGNLINTFQSMTEAQRQTGVDRNMIRVVCNGKFKQGNGYVWKFKS